MASELRIGTAGAEKVCELVRSAAQLDLHRKPGPQLAQRIHGIFGFEAVAILDADLNEIYQAGEWFPGLEETVRNIFVFETMRDDPEKGLIRRVLRVRNLPIGALLLRGEADEETSSRIAELIAVTFDRYHALANEMRMESAKKAEQLRSTVLDSLAHAYKTPLTAIQAAASGLAEMGSLSAAQSAMVSLIMDQAALLDRITTRLLRTARLESQSLHAELIAIAPLVEDVIAAAREQLASLRVKVDLARDDLSLVGDRSLLESMLAHFLENAGKYAEAGTTVTVGAAERPGCIVLSVHNRGPVIPASEHERIFDRYFRSATAEHLAPGTGIGLSVAKQAALAHGGHVWVTSNEREGTTFFAALPVGSGAGAEGLAE